MTKTCRSQLPSEAKRSEAKWNETKRNEAKWSEAKWSEASMDSSELTASFNNKRVLPALRERTFVKLPKKSYQSNDKDTAIWASRSTGVCSVTYFVLRNSTIDKSDLRVLVRAMQEVSTPVLIPVSLVPRVIHQVGRTSTFCTSEDPNQVGCYLYCSRWQKESISLLVPVQVEILHRYWTK